MRPVKEITAKEENFRLERVLDATFSVIRRDPVEPEPKGTIVLMPFCITDYSQDCDGSLMAKMEAINVEGIATGWNVTCIGLYPDSGLVVTLDELKVLFDKT